MPRNGGGVYSLPAAYDVDVGDTIQPSDHETAFEDIESVLNEALPIVVGGTGATTASAARTNLAVAGTGVTNTFTAAQIITSTDSGAGVEPVLQLFRNSPSPAAADSLGAVAFQGKDNGGNTLSYARIYAVIDDAVDGTEDGTLNFQTVVDGTLRTILALSDRDMTLINSGVFYTADQTSGAGNIGSGQHGTDAVAIEDDQVSVQGGTVSNLRLSKPTGYSNSNLATFTVNGTAVGTISTNGTTTAYNTSSDENLKENIRPTAADGIAFAKALSVRDFRWKRGRSEDTGFVAQELRQVAPDAVSTMEDGTLGYDAGKLVPRLVRTIQQLIERVEALENP